MDQFRVDIQGLRAIAVLLVLLFHINNKLLPGGFVGVDVFFVISGFLITSIIVRQKDKQAFSFVDFYKSRIKRIVPAYYILLLLIAAIGAFVFIKSDIPQFTSCLKSAALFKSNRYFSSLDTYFGAEMSENPLLHTWTLAVEMQFYFFLPFVIYFFSSRNTIILLLVLFFVLLGYSQYNIQIGNKSTMYFSLLARAPEFLIGSFISLIKIKIAKPNISSGLGLILILASAVFINEDSLFPGLLSLIPCIGASLILISLDSSINKYVLSSKPAVYIGELSYSIYLWHWPVLAFLRYYKMDYDLSISTILVALPLIWFLSELSYRYIEGYFRNANRNFIWLKIGGGTVVTMSSFFLVKQVNARVYTYSDYYTVPTFLGMSTHADSYQKDTIRGAKIATDTLLLLGDSYGLVMGAYLDELGKRNAFAVRSVTNDSYPTISGLSSDIPSSYKRAKYESLISKATPFYSTRIILFAKRWDFNIPSFRKAFTDFTNKLSKDQHLIIFSDFPSLDKNPIRSIHGIVKNEEVIFKKSVAAIPPFVLQLAVSNQNIHILDISGSSVFKDAPFSNDTVMYYDAHHLNRYGATKYALSTEQRFMDLLNSIKKH